MDEKKSLSRSQFLYETLGHTLGEILSVRNKSRTIKYSLFGTSEEKPTQCEEKAEKPEILFRRLELELEDMNNILKEANENLSAVLKELS